MKAAVLEKPYHMEIREVDDPEPPGPGQVLIRVAVTGICGSEIQAYKGLHPYRIPPVILGHELAGQVTAVGPGVTTLQVGDRVTVEPQVGCGQCIPCRRGRYHLCHRKRVLGTQDWPGSYGEYIVAPQDVVYKLPDRLSYEEGAMVEPLAVGLHAVRRGGVQAGEHALVLGGGTIGLCTGVMAKLAGCSRVVVTDLYEYNRRKAEEMGLEGVLADSDGVRRAASSLNYGEGPDVVFVTVGTGPVVGEALSLVRKGGRVVMIAFFEGEIQFDLFPLVGSEEIMIGSLMYTRDDFLATIEVLERGRIDAKPFVTKVMPINEAQRGMEIVHRKLENVVKVQLAF